MDRQTDGQTDLHCNLHKQVNHKTIIPSVKNNFYETQLFDGIYLFLCLILYTACAVYEQLIVLVPSLMNFLFTVGSKATIECDVKLAGFEEP